MPEDLSAGVPSINELLPLGKVSAELASKQGGVDPGKVAELAVELSDMGCYEVSLGDTTGVATPASTLKVLQVHTPLYEIFWLLCQEILYLSPCEESSFTLLNHLALRSPFI